MRNIYLLMWKCHRKYNSYHFFH